MPSPSIEGIRFSLRRGRNDPIIWPFDSLEAAEEWRDEHPSLIDYKPRREGDPTEKHEAICAHDREQWPCRKVRLDRRARGIIHAARNTCSLCGKQMGWLKVEFRGAGEFGEDLRFHGKLGACFNEAKRMAATLNDEGALKQIAQIEGMRERERARRRGEPQRLRAA